MKAPSTSSTSLASSLLALRRWQRKRRGSFPWPRFQGIGLPRAYRRRLAMAMTLLAGYCLAGLVGQGGIRDRQGSTAATVDVASTESFSEIQAVKETLNRLRQEHVESLRAKVVGPTDGDLPTRQWSDPAVTRRLEALIEEFSGTDQALLMTHLLLSTLRQQERWDRWMDVYLAAVYRHPTTRMVAYESDRAVLVARNAGREDELNRAFRYLAQIPGYLTNSASELPVPETTDRSP